MYRKLPSLIIILITVFYGCEKSEPAIDVGIGEIKEHIVTLEQARKIAVLNTMLPSVSKGKSGSFVLKTDSSISEKQQVPKRIKDYLAVDCSQKEPSFYIFNYEEGGFIIVSGDDRLYPVLAYSEDSSFPLEKGSLCPSGLVGWLANTDEMVKEIRQNNYEQSQEISPVGLRRMLNLKSCHRGRMLIRSVTITDKSLRFIRLTDPSFQQHVRRATDIMMPCQMRVVLNMTMENLL